MDEELEKLRKKRLRQLQEQVNQSFEEQEIQQQEYEETRKTILRAILTPEARQRLNTLKMARPEIVEKIENQLIILAQSGRLRNKITDEQLKELLSRLMPKKRDIKIRRR